MRIEPISDLRELTSEHPDMGISGLHAQDYDSIQISGCTEIVGLKAIKTVLRRLLSLEQTRGWICTAPALPAYRARFSKAGWIENDEKVREASQSPVLIWSALLDSLEAQNAWLSTANVVLFILGFLECESGIQFVVIKAYASDVVATLEAM